MTANPKEQDRNGKIVARDVLACQSGLVDTIIQHSYSESWVSHELFGYEDIENYYMRVDIDDLIRENLDEFVDWLLDPNVTVLTDWYNDEYEAWGKLNLNLDTSESEETEQFWSWLLEQKSTSLDDVEKVRRDLLFAIDIKEDDEKASLYEYFQDHGVKIEDNWNEIYEWWLVTDWLARKLKAKGEAILEFGLSTWWGRRTTGQSIVLDGVISEIAEDLWGPIGEDADYAETTD